MPHLSAITKVASINDLSTYTQDSQNGLGSWNSKKLYINFSSSDHTRPQRLEFLWTTSNRQKINWSIDISCLASNVFLCKNRHYIRTSSVDPTALITLLLLFSCTFTCTVASNSDQISNYQVFLRKSILPLL